MCFYQNTYAALLFIQQKSSLWRRLLLCLFPQTCPVCGIVYSHVYACVWKFVTGYGWELMRRAAWAATRRSRQGPGHQGDLSPKESQPRSPQWDEMKPLQPSTMSPPSLCTWTGRQQVPLEMFEAPRRNLRNAWLSFGSFVLFLSSCFVTVFIWTCSNCLGRHRKALRGKLRVLRIN